MKTIMETQRLILRELVMDDLPATWEIVGNDLTMAAWNGAWSEEETIAGIEKQIQSYRKNGFGRWAVVLKGTARVIGICGLQYKCVDMPHYIFSARKATREETRSMHSKN